MAIGKQQPTADDSRTMASRPDIALCSYLLNAYELMNSAEEQKSADKIIVVSSREMRSTFTEYHFELLQRTRPHPSGSSKQTALPFQ